LKKNIGEMRPSEEDRNALRRRGGRRTSGEMASKKQDMSVKMVDNNPYSRLIVFKNCKTL
jgi:hypothetical protein